MANQSVSKRPPWVIVAGGFHTRGGMDRANIALADCLADQGYPVHLVGHDIAESLSQRSGVVTHRVPRPLGSIFLGEFALDAVGKYVANRIRRRDPQSLVIVNGSNCLCGGMNWIHYVHSAWSVTADRGSIWRRIKTLVYQRMARSREGRAFRSAPLLIANSERSRQDVVDAYGVDPAIVHVVYLGNEHDWGIIQDAERRAARSALSIPADAWVGCFVGALGHDDRKGFQVALQSWIEQIRAGIDPGLLVIAGNGPAAGLWRQLTAESPAAPYIRFVGFSNDIRQILAASDYILSPVHYEAFGLNVQEALCSGLPAVVSSTAGVSEIMPSEMHPLLIADSSNSQHLTDALTALRADPLRYRVLAESLSHRLQQYTWRSMAENMISLIIKAHSYACH